jgi:hypothetical protein
LFDEKTEGRKSRDTVPLIICEIISHLVTGSHPSPGSPVLIKLDQAVVISFDTAKSAALKYTIKRFMEFGREMWLSPVIQATGRQEQGMA